MKNAYFLAIATSSLYVSILMGCKSTSSIASSKGYANLGSLSVKLVHDNKPSNVASVVLSMFSNGQATLSDTLPLSTDSLLTYSFQKVSIGKWNLLINAMDNGGNLIYFGQRQVLVKEDTTSTYDISFSLSTSTIQITLDWGSQSSDWIDFANNPILGKSQTDTISNGLYTPKILFENGQYKMWFTYYQPKSTSQCIGYATSQDGVQWTQPQPTDITLGAVGTWDSENIIAGPVILINNQYFMYYNGASNSTLRIGLATSANGINWTKQVNPILVPTTAWETSNIGATEVIKMGAAYYLYYHGVNTSGNTAICLATSPDGFFWTKYSANPILEASQPWELQGGIYFPSIINDNGLLKMLYASRVPNNEGFFGIATSIDGIAWTKESLNPFFSVQTSQSSWAQNIGYACWRQVGNQYNIYYSGMFQNISPSGTYAIGLLQKK